MRDHYTTENYVILDIETTGLSPAFSQIILIGLIHYNNGWQLTQIFCDHTNEEADLLQHLLEILKKDHLIVTYNGHAFDLPFINKRLEHHQFKRQLNLYKHFDLYRVVRASKKALGLPNYKLKTIEEYLGIYREDQISGKESVELYFQFMHQPNEKLRDIILLHNADDIRYMLPTLGILNHIPKSITEKFYPYHFEEYMLTDFEVLEDFIKLKCYSNFILPSWTDFHDGYQFVATDHTIELTLPIFKLSEYTFVDPDVLPFISTSFNEMTVEEQKSFMFFNKEELFRKSIHWITTYYPLER
ncbi:MAG: ribonuclease H-like domain-containing protein [Clostridia bacterium]|nr:ribonuclease H-like domain-containing protein [Clostridia bacterium]